MPTSKKLPLSKKKKGKPVKAKAKAPTPRKPKPKPKPTTANPSKPPPYTPPLPPTPLSTEALAIYTAAATTLAATPTNTNLTLIGFYAVAVERARIAQRIIDAAVTAHPAGMGLLILSPNGTLTENPAVRIATAAEAHAVKLATELGLTPPSHQTARTAKRKINTLDEHHGWVS